MNQRKSPAPPQRRAPRNTTNDIDSTAYRRQDGYAAPTAQDRHEARLLSEVRALGFVVSVRCRICQHPLTAPKSVAAHVGPRCAAKAVAV
jgi:hypothetical protein